jgi:hypothetical protein
MSAWTIQLVGYVCACGNFVVKGTRHRCGAVVLRRGGDAT